MKDFVNKLREDIASIWTLLNDTEVFLNRTKLISEYENDIRRWRSKIQSFRNHPEVRKEVREDIISLRKSLRLQGYDLRLGSKDIKCYGFKSDDASVEGFKRCIIIIVNSGKDLYGIAGEGNHLQLYEFLTSRLHSSNIHSFTGVHSLWYRWKNNILELCGADSETKDDFEKLKVYVDNNKSLILKRLKDF